MPFVDRKGIGRGIAPTVASLGEKIVVISHREKFLKTKFMELTLTRTTRRRGYTEGVLTDENGKRLADILIAPFITFLPALSFLSLVTIVTFTFINVCFIPILILKVLRCEITTIFSPCEGNGSTMPPPIPFLSTKGIIMLFVDKAAFRR